MLSLNWAVIFGSCVIPLLVGAIYYHPSLLGTASARASGRDLGQGYSPKVYIFTLLLGVLLAVFLMPTVLHAVHVYSLLGGDVPAGTPEATDVEAFIQKYGGNFRTFGHGALHGTIAAVFGAWPILAIIALFEGRSWKYTAIHVGYFAIVLGLMGGIICAFA